MFWSPFKNGSLVDLVVFIFLLTDDFTGQLFLNFDAHLKWIRLPRLSCVFTLKMCSTGMIAFVVVSGKTP